jgi:hypothetical protein
MAIPDVQPVEQKLTHILLVRNDGRFAVAHVESGGLAMTHSGAHGAEPRNVNAPA